jgi:hypothetical protein
MTKDKDYVENLPEMLKENELTVRILEDRPEIAIVKTKSGKHGDLGLIGITAILKAGGVERIIYDLSQVPTARLNGWLPEFDNHANNILKIKTRYIGINISEFQPETADEEHSCHKNIAQNLDYALR